MKKIAVATDFLGSHHDVFDAMKTLAEAGFTHLHWCHEWCTTYFYSDREIADFGVAMRALGLSLLDIHGSDGGGSGHVNCSWSSPDPVGRQAGVELVLNRLRMMAMLHGEGTLMMHIPFYGVLQSKEGRAATTRRYEALRRSLDELVPVAQALKIPLALENMVKENYEILEQLFADYPADAVGLCYDSGHGNIQVSETIPASGIEFLERNKDRLLALHLHDNRGLQDEHQPPRYGTIDWPRLVKAIRSSKSYQGPLSFEMAYHGLSATDRTPAEWARDAYDRCCSVEP